MRATPRFVVFSSLLLAANAYAQPSAAPTGSKPASGTTPATGTTPTTTGSAPTTTGTTPTTTGTTPTTGTPGAAPTSTGSPDPASVKPEDMPTAVRMRRLEQKTQALKERAWQLKARVQMLKEQVIGGGVGSQALIAHANDMGSSFRLIKVVYSLDGTQVFARSDDSAENLYKTKAFDVFAGPIAPGNHTMAIEATYRGHGYGVFEYLTKYTFTARGNQTFSADEGKLTKVDCRGYEKGGATTPLEKRPSIECKVTSVSPERPAENPAPASAPAATTTTPGS